MATATVFNPITKERKVVTVGDPNAFAGGFKLETPTQNLQTYTANATPTKEILQGPGVDLYSRNGDVTTKISNPAELSALVQQGYLDTRRPLGTAQTAPLNLTQSSSWGNQAPAAPMAPSGPSTPSPLTLGGTGAPPGPSGAAGTSGGVNPSDSYQFAIMSLLKGAQSGKTDEDLLAQRNALINSRFNSVSNPTPEALRVLSPDQQMSLRNQDYSGIQDQLAGVNTALQGREKQRANAADQLKIGLDFQKTLEEESKPIEVNGQLVQKQADGTYKVVFGEPKAAGLASGIVGEYQFALSQGWKGKGDPSTWFSQYQDEDANRHVLASAIAGQNGLTPAQTQNFLTITNKFQADSIMKVADKGAQAIQIADQVLANPGSATNQLKVLYSLVKNLDPDSAVREGELDLAQKTQSYFDQFKTSLTRISEGQIISPASASALATASKELAMTWYQSASRRQTQYQSQATIAGVGPAFQQYIAGFTQPYSGSTTTTKPTQTFEQYVAAQESAAGTSFSPAKREQLRADWQLQNSGLTNESQTSLNGTGIVGRIAKSIGQFESGGNYKAIGPATASGDKAYGKYQVMGNNIPSWSKEALGYSITPAQFLNSPALQDQIANYKMGQAYEKYGSIEDVASVWFSGRPMSQAGNAQDVIGTTVPQYIKNILAIYGRLG